VVVARAHLGSVMQWDGAHVTRDGSRDFIDLIANRLFSPPRLSGAVPADAATR
jgi:hypothetical protein